ncbi:hypothetical protein RRG08_066599 [Elysia crispata]|uniref:Uncharacterized protein n=1 Tax=Elysia crispata TaxID=231223 RepID=A0AAE1CMZ0_9GAST|nr:hypothetical protein RRG08_066599 [Elysia crispata]
MLDGQALVKAGSRRPRLEPEFSKWRPLAAPLETLEVAGSSPLTAHVHILQQRNLVVFNVLQVSLLHEKMKRGIPPSIKLASQLFSTPSAEGLLLY